MLDGAELLVDISGRTVWTFSSKSTDVFSCELVKSSTKGLLLRSRVPKACGVNIIQERIFICYPSGKHFQRVCSYCKFISVKSVKKRDDCKSLFFCHEDCMKEADHLITTCGSALDRIRYSIKSENIDVAHMLIFLLYSRSIIGDSYFQNFLKLEQHESCNTKNSHLDHLSKSILSILTDINSFWSSQDLNISMLKRLLLAIEYNLQTIPILSLPNTNLLCLTTTLSRINHSCEPNSQLLFTSFLHKNTPTSSSSSSSSTTTTTSSSKSQATSIHNHVLQTVHLKAIRDILENEEITISYLTNPITHPVLRKKILQDSFHFDCDCRRCQRELLQLQDLDFQQQLIQTSTSLFNPYPRYGEVLALLRKYDAVPARDMTLLEVDTVVSCIKEYIMPQSTLSMPASSVNRPFVPWDQIDKNINMAFLYSFYDVSVAALFSLQQQKQPQQSSPLPTTTHRTHPLHTQISASSPSSLVYCSITLCRFLSAIFSHPLINCRLLRKRIDTLLYGANLGRYFPSRIMSDSRDISCRMLCVEMAQEVIYILDNMQNGPLGDNNRIIGMIGGRDNWLDRFMDDKTTYEKAIAIRNYLSF